MNPRSDAAAAAIPETNAAIERTEHLRSLSRLLSVLARQLAERDAQAFASTPEASVDNRDSYQATALGDVIDRSLHAATAHWTLGLSPASFAAAYFDWAAHLAFSPGKQLQLVEKARRKTRRLATYAWRTAMKNDDCAKAIEPLAHDRRFRDEAWQKWPFDVIHQAFLLHQQWWHNATTEVRGVTKQHEAMVEFVSRQMLDVLAPSNFILTNPKIFERTMTTGGMNFAAGWRNMIGDWERAATGRKPVGTENFEIGRNVAVTPGKVVYRNALIELIQYAPATDKVRPEPILIVPAWIMKYYILDLSPRNSLVKYLTQQGFTVFMVSWRNPGPRDRSLGLDDYRTAGVMTALDVVNAIVPTRKVHAVGYCLGGTLLAIAAAAMARDADDRLKSITLLGAQTDFTEPGELGLFINESQVTFLEDMMWEQGVLDTKQMAGAFQLLRTNDLVWSYMARNYLMGERDTMTDLMAWNADTTRMPYRMHSEYLRRLFLDNDLAAGRFKVGGRPVALSDIRTPIFAVGTTADHVAPWRSTHKIHLQTGADVTFVLASGGHNAGIVSELDHPGQNFQVMTSGADDPYVDPEMLQADAPHKAGSWWPEWANWVAGHSGAPVDPPQMGIAGEGTLFGDAPGTYVRQR
jgi:polyhydroxyalkanoate synthase